MARADGEPLVPVSAPVRAVAYTDAEGRATDDPAAAVRGELVEYDDDGVATRRTRFFMTERELSWLPVSEAAFLLWVLVVLMVVWLGIGVVLFLT